MVDFISNITMFNVEDNRKVAANKLHFGLYSLKKLYPSLQSYSHYITLRLI